MKHIFFLLMSLLATMSTASADSALFTTTATLAVRHLQGIGFGHAAIDITCVTTYQNNTVALVDAVIGSGDPFDVIVYEAYKNGKWHVLDANSNGAGAGIAPMVHLGISKATAQQILAGTAPCIK